MGKMIYRAIDTHESGWIKIGTAGEWRKIKSRDVRKGIVRIVTVDGLRLNVEKGQLVHFEDRPGYALADRSEFTQEHKTKGKERNE